MEDNNSTQSPSEFLKHEEGVHLLDYYRIFRRRWRIALFCFLLTFSVVAVKTFLTKPVFEAYSVLEVGKNDNGGVLGAFDLDQDSSVSTAVEILTSRTIVSKVVRELGLDWRVVPPSFSSKVTIEKVQLPPHKTEYLIEVLSAERFSVKRSDGQSLGEGTSSVPLLIDDGIVKINIDSAGVGDIFKLERLPFDALVTQLKRSIRAHEVGRATNILKISYQSTDATQARDIVNGLARAYYEYSIQNKTKEAGKTVDFIDGQITNLKKELDRSERELQQFKVNSGGGGLSSDGLSLVSNLVDLEQKKNKLNLKRGHVVKAINALSEAIKNRAYFTPLIIDGVDLSSDVAAILTELAAEQDSLLREYSPAHPAVVSIQKKMIQSQQTLLNVYDSGLKKIDLDLEDISSLISSTEDRLEKIPAAEMELAKLTRVNQVNSELYTFLLQKQQEARIAKASTLSNVEILDPAVTPRNPVKPNKKKNILLGLLLGLLVGVGITFFLDYMDDTLAGSEDVYRHLHLPIIGTIPRLPTANGADPTLSLVSAMEPKSSFVEAFRALRTGIHFSNVDGAKEVLLVTSSLPDEGKTTISANLALALAQTGAKVLLLGCDLRRPGFYDMFDTENIPGLADYLADDADGYLHHISGTSLDLISAGSISPNPVELLGSEKMAGFISDLKSRYDHIVIDAPPVLPVADSQVLSSLVDHVLVVIEPYRVPLKAAQRMLESLVSGNAKNIGVVLNDKTGKGSKYYGGYSYYGHSYYGSYYGNADQDKRVKKTNMLGRLFRS